ncbi:DNA repair protein rad18 [Rhinocladiella mackenziei CBS 650.93]|uniref:Postreplication repair E3 ubiquitin-protein ligase RAD18 n=1 Tax=Rhinocladiella mackenziei CBS 650.93 TaxID=1442369 RepID=A0A0D2IZA2_9EURO|nr:DNA repair protein rad18 [Rhinocladiella mackenziei CBS 650.93]KIX08751.1 DNA repair protein rad18 [Rhinocladiella mackenziei CBS 650.93]
MLDQDEFTDSTDWLSTPLAALAPLDSSLRCQVCKDFFTTPMITSCSHTFCSLCIRRYLSQEGRCPACRESDQEIKLRRNWVVEELVANFNVSRKGLLAFAKNAAQKPGEDIEPGRPKKRRKVAEVTSNGVGIERRSTRSQSRRMASDDGQQSLPSPQEAAHDSEDEGGVYEDQETGSSNFINGNSEPNDGLVECPCCRRRMKETLINSHLDKCIVGESHTPQDDSPSPAPPNRQIAPPGTIAYAQKPRAKQSERLPFINYSLLNETALRKKLRDLGIPNHGPKDLMRRRHTEWVNLWNANCDSTNPVTKRHLLQDLKIWEDTLGRQMDKVATSGFMAKDFDRELHVKTQKSNFDDLIKLARQKKTVVTDKATVSIDETPAEGRPSTPPNPNPAPSPQPGDTIFPEDSTTTVSPIPIPLPQSSEAASSDSMNDPQPQDRLEPTNPIPNNPSSEGKLPLSATENALGQPASQPPFHHQTGDALNPYIL